MQVTTRFLASYVKIDSNRRLVILPKVCSWFPNDFTIKRSGATASPIDCLRVIAPYLRPEPRATLIRLISDGTNPSVRFKNFNFRCKVLSLYHPHVHHTSRSTSAVPGSASGQGAAALDDDDDDSDAEAGTPHARDDDLSD